MAVLWTLLGVAVGVHAGLRHDPWWCAIGFGLAYWHLTADDDDDPDTDIRSQWRDELRFLKRWRRR